MLVFPPYNEDMRLNEGKLQQVKTGAVGTQREFLSRLVRSRRASWRAWCLRTWRKVGNPEGRQGVPDRGRGRSKEDLGEKGTFGGRAQPGEAGGKGVTRDVETWTGAQSLREFGLSPEGVWSHW